MVIEGIEAASSEPHDEPPSARGHRGDATLLPAPQAAMYDLLTDQPEPCTAAALAALIGQHPNTVREHLTGLIESGLVEQTRSRSRAGPGRPAWLYWAVDTTTAT